MSNAIFPSLPGLKPEVRRTPIFNTQLSGTDSGREFAISSQLYARYKFHLQYEFLRSLNGFNELQTLVGFFLQRRGRLDDFLFSDEDDRLVTTAQTVGIGNAVNRSFQLVRSIGGAVEPIGAVDGTPAITINGSATVAYTVDANGLVTFTTAPAAAAVLAWTGAFFFRVRFLQDESEFERFLQGLHRGQIEFRSFRP